jgi:hypothetical protein
MRALLLLLLLAGVAQATDVWTEAELRAAVRAPHARVYLAAPITLTQPLWLIGDQLILHGSAEAPLTYAGPGTALWVWGKQILLANVLLDVRAPATIGIVLHGKRLAVIGLYYRSAPPFALMADRDRDVTVTSNFLRAQRGAVPLNATTQVANNHIIYEGGLHRAQGYL